MPGVPLRREATYQDLLAVDDRLVAEILNGELHTSPRPGSQHALAATVMGADLTVPFHGSGGGPRGPGGWWLLYEPELHLGPQVVVPDLAGWRVARMPVFPSVPAFDIPPDWVCEVTSPRTTRIDRVDKMPIYGKAGVSHLWLVDPLARTVEAYRLEDERWVVLATRGGDDRVRIEPFEAIELELGRWWLPEPPPEPGTDP